MNNDREIEDYTKRLKNEIKARDYYIKGASAASYPPDRIDISNFNRDIIDYTKELKESLVKKICSNCLFYKYIGDTELTTEGQCRIMPPVVSDPLGETFYPSLNGDDWCGAFELANNAELAEIPEGFLDE